MEFFWNDALKYSLLLRLYSFLLFMKDLLTISCIGHQSEIKLGNKITKNDEFEERITHPTNHW